MTVLLIHSHFGPTPAPFASAEADGRIRVVRERDLGPADFDAVSGLITTTHLDQVGFLYHQASLERLLDRGGRWFFNGHILRILVDGLGIYVPIERPKRADYALTRLNEHPIFSDIDQKNLEEQKGVAGFYGRGYNPLPAGALAVNGIGSNLHPIDWEWLRPKGRRIFSHAGNDLGGMGAATGDNAVLSQRILAWCAGEIGQ